VATTKRDLPGGFRSFASYAHGREEQPPCFSRTIDNVVSGLGARRLGSTGLTVSRIGLGLAALGRPAYINLGRDQDYGHERTVAAMEQRCHATLDAAYAAGVRYVDAARSYGLAESFLGSWLSARQLSRDALTIGSKWGYSYVGAWRLDASVHEVKNLSVEILRRQIVESRTLLGDRLRLYQIHSATIESGVLDDGRVLDELGRLQSEGLAIGLTVTGPGQAEVIRRALDVNTRRANLFQVVQATWNLLEPSAGPALADAKALGLGVIVKEALANGRLTDRNIEDNVLPLKTYADAHRTSPDVVALAAALSNSWVDVVLSGAVTVEQLTSNLQAAVFSERLGHWPEIAERSHEYWDRRRTLPWQ
jgi:aryl-alcohol dehydrogenase-like predicted oxidoreductase